MTQPLFPDNDSSPFTDACLCAIYHTKCLGYGHRFAGSLTQSSPQSGPAGFGINKEHSGLTSSQYFHECYAYLSRQSVIKYIIMWLAR
jgi:hypothetical protein